MWRIGFGLEKLGLLAVRLPVLFTAGLFLLCLFASINIIKLKFDGNITVVLPDKSIALQDYKKLGSQYRNFSRDVTILIKHADIDTAAGLEVLREVQLEVALSEGVENASSILSLPDFDPETGKLKDWFPQEFSDDAQVKSLIDGIIEKYPQSRSMFSVEDKVAVIIATLSMGVQDDDDKSFIAYQTLRNAAEDVLPEGYEIYFTGLTPVGATVVAALISDQVKLTGFGLLLGAALAFYIFRSFLAALICAFPPALTALWSLGLFAYFEISISFLTTVLPTLALILAFADGIFLYFRWQTLNSIEDDYKSNLIEAITRVGPASSLTSLTTALAFLSFLYAGSQALDEFAYLGAAVVLIGFIGVIIGMPLFIYWLIRLNLVPTVMSRPPMFLNFGKYVRKIPLKRPVMISIIGLILVVAMSFVHQFVRPEYKITDYLPKDAAVYKAELLANDIIGGRSLMLVSVPLVEGSSLSNSENIKRTEIVEAILKETYLEERIFSATKLVQSLKSDVAREKIDQMIKEAPPSARTDFLSNTGSHALISVRLPSNSAAGKVATELSLIRDKLSKYDFSKDVVISGFPVLMATEFTKLIDQLRWSLLLAICMGIAFIGLATRSPFITLAAILPNLFPIFFVQVLIYLRGGTINMTEVVALTVAFGIAIDNAVHLINVYDYEKRKGKISFHALSSALEDCGPALAAGTTIICAATIVTQISNLPTVPVIGQLIIATLAVALLANLILFPANILTLEYFTKKWSKQGQ